MIIRWNHGRGGTKRGQGFLAKAQTFLEWFITGKNVEAEAAVPPCRIYVTPSVLTLSVACSVPEISVACSVPEISIACSVPKINVAVGNPNIQVGVSCG